MDCKLQKLMLGGSRSWLHRVCGDRLMEFIDDRSLLKETPATANVYVRNGILYDIEQESEDRFVATGGPLCDEFAIDKQDAISYKLNLKAFLTEILGMEYAQRTVTLSPLRPGVDDGACRICNIPYLGVTLYWCPHNSNDEFHEVERDCENFSNSVVIVVPSKAAPSRYASSIGNLQYVGLDELFEQMDETVKPPTCYLKKVKGAKQSKPWQTYPKKIHDHVMWSNIQLSFTSGGKITISIDGKSETHMQSDIYFTRPVANSSKQDSKQVLTLKLLGVFRQWKPLTGKYKKRLQRLSDDMQRFFRQPSPIYYKGQDGLYHLALTVKLEDESIEFYTQLRNKVLDERANSGLRKIIESCGLTDTKSGKVCTQDFDNDDIGMLERMLN